MQIGIKYCTKAFGGPAQLGTAVGDYSAPPDPLAKLRGKKGGKGREGNEGRGKEDVIFVRR